MATSPVMLELTSNTRLWPFPSTVRELAPGPTIETADEKPSSPWVSVIVPVAAASNVMVSPADDANNASRNMQSPAVPLVQWVASATPSPIESTVSVVALAGMANAASSAVVAPPASSPAEPNAPLLRAIDRRVERLGDIVFGVFMTKSSF